MASAGTSALADGGVFSAIPTFGFVVTVGAALFDAYVIMPQLQGKGRNRAKSPRLLDSPVGSNEPGAPRISAYGIRVRVPTHVLWQAEKVRETTAGSTKAGTLTPQRRVYFDALVSLNDRITDSLAQLIGNGKLVLTKTRNLVEVRSAAMVVSIDSGRVVLTMGDNADPDFSQKFAVGDVVQLSGFIVASGTDINVGFWKVYSVAEHTSTPSEIVLARYSGQNIVATSATAGTLFSPAVIARVDDRIFNESGAYAGIDNPSLGGTRIYVPVSSHLDPRDVFDPNAECALLDFSAPGFGSLQNRIFRFDAEFSTASVAVFRSPQYSNTTGANLSLTGASSTDAAEIVWRTYPRFTTGLFPATFDPETYFHNGSEDQEEDALLADAEGTGEVPAFRGVACQGLDEFYATMFGDQLPYSLEAVIDVDPLMTWSEALATIVSERANIPRTAINVDGVDPLPFLGAYFRGPVPAATSLQPLLMAGQIVGQERDGTIALFQIENADVVSIVNGDDLTHFGARPEGEQPDGDKWTIEDQAVEDMPSSVGVRHQDPDNQYADGYQHFGLRNPAGVDHQNEQELDLSNVVLTRKDAAGLAATVLRRAWVNRRTFRFQLPPAYLDLLENDILTWTDDEGETQVVRIVQRDIGSDFRVHVVAVREDLEVGTNLVAVESAAGSTPRRAVGSAAVDVQVVDAPAIRQDELAGPMLRIAVAAAGGPWGGASIYESLDGSSWNLVGVVGAQAVIGTFTDTLAGSDPAESYGTEDLFVDDSNVVTVQFSDYGTAVIDGCTQAEAAGGKNWCALVAADGTTEIAAFTTASDLGDNEWQLGGWLRGLRGTSAGNLATGTRLVLLSGPGSDGVFLRSVPGAVSPKALAYKVVPAGMSIEDVEAVSIVAQWRNVLPLPVRAVAKSIDGDNNARFTVTHQWTRDLLPLGTQPPHAMDELVESYRFTIYDPTGAKVRRTFDIEADRTGSVALRDRWITYSSDVQTVDGYTPGPSETFWVDVQQIGAYGLGPSIKQEL